MNYCLFFMTADQGGASCGLVYKLLKAVKIRWHTASSKTNKTWLQRNCTMEVCITMDGCLPSNIYMMSWSNFCTAVQWSYCTESDITLSCTNLHTDSLEELTTHFPRMTQSPRLSFLPKPYKNSSLMKRCYRPPQHRRSTLTLLVFVSLLLLRNQPTRWASALDLINF